MTSDESWYQRLLGIPESVSSGGIVVHSAETITREIREELGAEVKHVIWQGTLENLFTCEGEPGLEIVLIFDAVFTDRALYEKPLLHGHEAGASVEAFTAGWRSLDELADGSQAPCAGRINGFFRGLPTD